MTRVSDEELVAMARAVRSNAYAPYSSFAVGAALLGESGAVYLGVNVENAAYPVGMCAERSAVGTAVTAGERRFEAIAIVGGAALSFPCGMCRQTLAEFAPEIRIILATPDVQLAPDVRSLPELLPHAFGPSDLSD